MYTNIPGHEIIINHFNDKIISKVSLYGAVVFYFNIPVQIVILILHKKKHWLFMEGIGGNSYRLTWGVVKFALQHKKPWRGEVLLHFVKTVSLRDLILVKTDRVDPSQPNK